MRRRLMMASAGSIEPVSPSGWIFGSGFGASGNVITNKGIAMTQDTFLIPPNTTLFRTTEERDANGVLVNIWVYEWTDNDTWIVRTDMIGANTTLKTNQNCGKVRFAIAYNTATGLAMTQAVIDRYFGVSIKR